MRKRRYQTGSIQKSVRRGQLVWDALYYGPDGRRKRVTLGPREQRQRTPPSELRVRLEEILAPVNSPPHAAAPASDPLVVVPTLADFIEGVYIPFKRERWKASSALTTEQRLRQHLVNGELGPVPLSALTRQNMQAALDRRRSEGQSLVNHLRWDLNAIFKLAIADGLVTRNPASVLHAPGLSPAQSVMSPEQVRNALLALPLRERAFCRLAIYAGLRPGEIIALRWRDISGIPDGTEGSATIDDRYYKGDQDSPKSRHSRQVALSPSVMEDLKAWRAARGGSSGGQYDDLLFPAVRRRGRPGEPVLPIKYENVWQREIRPRLAEVGLEWADFRCMRRTNSTLMRASGADAKVSADQRGHGLGVAMSEYTHSTLDQKLTAVAQFERWLGEQAVCACSMPLERR